MKPIIKAMNALCALGLAILLTAPSQAASIVYDYTGTLAFQSNPLGPVDLLGLDGATFHWVGTFTVGDTPSLSNNVNLDRFAGGNIALTLSGTVGGLRDGTFAPTTDAISELFGSGGNDQFQFSSDAVFPFGAASLFLGPIRVPPGFTGAVSPTNTLTPFVSSDVLAYDRWVATDFTDPLAPVFTLYNVVGGSASGVVVPVAPPAIAKAFGAQAIPTNGSTSLTFTITNPAANTVAEVGVAFTDTLPAGLVVATPNGLTSDCGGTATAVEGATSVSLSGGTVGINASCTVSVNVTGTTDGAKNNSVQVSSANGGTGNTSTASITVAAPPLITKTFGTGSLPLNGSTSLGFTIQNSNATVALTGVAFTDTLPAGLVVATPNGLTSNCGGTTTALAGASSVSLTGGTVGITTSCTVSVNVTGTTAGVKDNSVQVTSTEGGAGNTSTASITVVAPPLIGKAFGAASIPLNGSTSLSFTVQNSNATVALTGIGFTDTLPAGLVVATPNGLTSTCGGTATATAGSNAVTLSGGTVAASASCTLSINVTGIAAGDQDNTTGNVTSANGGNGNAGSASITVVSPPTIAKSFSPISLFAGGQTTLTFTLTNPAANAVALTGIGFTDILPVGLGVPTTSGPACGGTLTTTGPTSVVLTGATIALNGTCTFSVTVLAFSVGDYVNTTSNVTSTNGGTGNTASATLTVLLPPLIPTLSGWVLALLATLLAAATLLHLRRRPI